MPEPVIQMLADLNVAAAISLAVSIVAAALVPYFLLVNVDFAAVWRTSTAAVREAWVQTALTLAALLILTIPTGDRS